MRVGQPSASPDPSAALDVSGGPYATGSPYRGIAPPKVALIQSSLAAPITNPTVGLLIYNTAKATDVIPGYYYWDGTKWNRLSTTGSGAVRIAAAGDPVPAYTLAQVHAWAVSGTAPPTLMLIEPGREGLFRLDDTVDISKGLDAMVVVTASPNPHRYKRIAEGNGINVKWFGAKGDGQMDDAPYIQAAVNYAKQSNTASGSPTHTIVYFPAGYYLIRTSIDITNTSTKPNNNTDGIWLVGEGGSQSTTVIYGATQNYAMFDFSGSSFSGCENFHFAADDNLAAVEGINISKIGVQFALTAKGGLNCGIRHCFFQMSDDPTANGGFGSIGLLNIRSEEFFIDQCVVQANTPLVFSYDKHLAFSSTTSTPSVDFTASSLFQALSPGTGSMGDISIKATSLKGIDRYGSAMVLKGTNSVNFQGYIGRVKVDAGTFETAILCANSTTHLKVHATVESYSRLLSARDGGFDNGDVTAIMSIAKVPSSELVDLTNTPTAGLKLNINLPIAGDRSRTILYHDPVGEGTQPATGSIINSEINCSSISDNQYVISPNLLKKSNNCVFNTPKPFAKKEGWIKQLNEQKVFIGQVNHADSVATIYQFLEARRSGATTSNAGFYRFKVDGVINAGSVNSGKGATRPFTGEIVVNQTQDGSGTPVVTMLLGNQSTSDISYLNITNISLKLSFSGGVGTVKVVAIVSGSGTNEEINFHGTTAVQPFFYAKDPISY
ncbi:hypothetical protein GCM10028773_14710 [Spirosoma koreense]